MRDSSERLVIKSPGWRPVGIGQQIQLVAVRTLNYVTNYVISHVPSFRARHFWYRRALGVRIGRSSGIYLGCYIWFYGPRHVRANGLVIGDYCRINRNCCLDVRGSIWIGDNVSISPDVTILTAEHLADHAGFGVVERPVRIEDHVWIGTRAMIMPGVTLGRGCVVAAGAVVTKDVAPLAIVAGVPARPIRRRQIDPDYVMDGPLPLFE